MPKVSREHAIVIGGGIAGLLAARVLLCHFHHVTLIERDHYPDDPVFRSGVPQGHHVHFLPLQGQYTLEVLFPGLRTKLLAQGAVERTYGAEGIGASVYYYGGRCPQIPPVLRGWNCSRTLLEWQIRQELIKYAHLQIMEGYEVVHLLKAEHAVCGVQFRARTHSSTNDLQELRSDLVIDASGSSSRIVTWLTELGYEAPREKITKTWVSYATRVYQPASSAPWKEIAIQTRQAHRRGGVLMEIEQGKWMVVLSGTGQEELPPTDDESYLAFARNLPEQALYEAIKGATPLSPISGYRKKENYMRRFHRQPEGLIIVGDAFCSFNPVYGQGITVAAQEAQLLDTCLRKDKGKKGFARKFQSRAARLVTFPWLLATSADSDRKGPTKRYIEGLTALLPHDGKTLLTFLTVLMMLRSPLALIHPLIVAKVLWYQWRTKS